MINKILDMLAKVYDWFLDTKLSLAEYIVYTLLAISVITLVVCIIIDAPLWYTYYEDGTVYMFTPRRGKVQVKEGK